MFIKLKWNILFEICKLIDVKCRVISLCYFCFVVAVVFYFLFQISAIALVRFLTRRSILLSEAPVYLSYPHFLNGDPSLVEAVEGLKPDPEVHGTFFKIQPKLGVTLSAKVSLLLRNMFGTI